MTHNNNVEYMHPEIIALCMNCKALSCNKGKCDAVFAKIKELRARGAGRKKKAKTATDAEKKGAAHAE